MLKSICFVRVILLLALLSSCAPKNQADVSVSEETLPSEANIVNLTQVGCQFLEVESRDYQYQPQSAEDCKKINAQTLSAREAEFKPLELQAGKYIFRVTNSNVPYELGFYLRGEGVKKLSLPKVSGGGLTTGKTQDYEITLAPGKYLFSCPLNPTPDYSVVVN